MTVAPFDLTGRRALVTGGAGGLGREMVLALAAAGAHVVIHHLGQDVEAEELAGDVRVSGAESSIVEGDVADWDAAAGFVEAAGPLDILVNNAGYMLEGKFTEMTLEEWRRTISVDLDGVFIVSRHAAVGMIKRGSGVIINLASQLAFKGAADFSSYCAAKGGVIGLTKAMARELGPTIRVNAVAPGPIITPMTAAAFSPELTKERTAGSVAGRMGEAHEVAPAIVYLASDASSFMHGQTLHLNGGGVMP